MYVYVCMRGFACACMYVYTYNKYIPDNSINSRHNSRHNQISQRVIGRGFSHQHFLRYACGLTALVSRQVNHQVEVQAAVLATFFGGVVVLEDLGLNYRGYAMFFLK